MTILKIFSILEDLLRMNGFQCDQDDPFFTSLGVDDEVSACLFGYRRADADKYRYCYLSMLDRKGIEDEIDRKIMKYSLDEISNFDFEEFKKLIK